MLQSNVTSQVNFTADFNWPSWSGENCFYIIAPDGSNIGCFCDPNRCYNGNSGSYSATNINLGTLACLSGDYIIRTYEGYGDGWNSSGTITIYANGQLIGTYGNTCTSAGCFQDFQFNILGYELDQETNPLLVSASGCNDGSIRVGGGAWRDLTVSPNTHYNFTWDVSPSNMNQGRIRSINGTGTTVTGNTIGWFSGTTTTVRVSTNRSSCTWSSTSAILTYRHTQPTNVIVTGGGTFCSTPITLNAGGGTYGTIFWQNNTSNGVNTSTPTTSQNVSVSGTYYFRANNNGCWSNQDSTSVTINTSSNTPTSINSTLNPTCGESTTLSVNGGSLGTGATWRWYSGSCVGTSIGSGSSISVSPTSTTTYFVRAEGTCNTTNCVQKTISVESPNIIGFNLSEIDFVWNGQNSDWSNHQNWLEVINNNLINTANIPTSTKNVLITNSSCNNINPSISSNQSVNNIIINSNSALSFVGDNKLSVYKNFDNRGTLYSGIGKIEFLGSNGNDTLFTNSGDIFYDIRINKPNGELVLGNNIIVKNELSIESGNLRLNHKCIDLESTGFLSNEGYDHRVYCDCPSTYIRRVVDIPTNTNINPGNLGLTITTSSKAMGETVIKRRHQRAEELNGVYRIFDVTPQFNGNLNLTLEFQYFTTEVEDLSLQSTFAIYRSTNDGGDWNEEGGFNIINDKTVIITGWNEFSWITVAPSQNGFALPVEYLTFTGKLIDKSVELNWVTATEINNNGFELERSQNGIDFERIAWILGSGNSSFIKEYNFIDFEPYIGINYYRLKQIDYDGKFEYSKIISVRVSNKDFKKITYFNYLGQIVEDLNSGLYLEFVEYFDGTFEIRSIFK